MQPGRAAPEEESPLPACVGMALAVTPRAQPGSARTSRLSPAASHPGPWRLVWAPKPHFLAGKVMMTLAPLTWGLCGWNG